MNKKKTTGLIISSVLALAVLAILGICFFLPPTEQLLPSVSGSTASSGDAEVLAETDNADSVPESNSAVIIPESDESAVESTAASVSEQTTTQTTSTKETSEATSSKTTSTSTSKTTTTTTAPPTTTTTKATTTTTTVKPATTTTTTTATAPTTAKPSTPGGWATPDEMNRILVNVQSYAASKGMTWDSSLDADTAFWATDTRVDTGGYRDAASFESRVKGKLDTFNRLYGYEYVNVKITSSTPGEYFMTCYFG